MEFDGYVENDFEVVGEGEAKIVFAAIRTDARVSLLRVRRMRYQFVVAHVKVDGRMVLEEACCSNHVNFLEELNGDNDCRYFRH